MNRQMRILMFALSSLAVVPALAQEAEAPQEAETQAEAKPVEVTPADEIVVEILGLENDTGQIGCRIFSKADGFPTKMKKADEQLYSKPKSKKGGCTFKGYKPQHIHAGKAERTLGCVQRRPCPSFRTARVQGMYVQVRGREEGHQDQASALVRSVATWRDANAGAISTDTLGR